MPPKDWPAHSIRFDNAEALLERGYATADKVSWARATLASAQAEVTIVQQDAEALTITAPFAGRIETLDLDEGEYVSAGTEIGRLVADGRHSGAATVVTRCYIGQPATIGFITGEERVGTVTFVARRLHRNRPHFGQIEVANADGAIPAGLSAEAIIPTGEATAFSIAVHCRLIPTRTLGMKTVNMKTLNFSPFRS
jgi:multidrug efflux system membrane fusion protein